MNYISIYTYAILIFWMSAQYFAIQMYTCDMYNHRLYLYTHFTDNDGQNKSRDKADQ